MGREKLAGAFHLFCSLFPIYTLCFLHWLHLTFQNQWLKLNKHLLLYDLCHLQTCVCKLSAKMFCQLS